MCLAHNKLRSMIDTVSLFSYVVFCGVFCMVVFVIVIVNVGFSAVFAGSSLIGGVIFGPPSSPQWQPGAFQSCGWLGVRVEG